MTIGAGWAEGAWVDAGWVVGAWEQPTATKTIGGTSQLEAFSSTGTLAVQNQETIGGTSQIEAFSSTGRLSLEWEVGGTSQLEEFSSTGFIQVGEVTGEATATGGWLLDYDAGLKHELKLRKKAKQKAKKAREKAEQIQSDIDKALALAEREIEEKDNRRKELQRLTKLADRHQATIRAISDRLDFVVKEAVERPTFSKMERMEREMLLLREEEEFMKLATEMILNA